ncbi:methyltransferase domain-containing protein [Brevibacillus laterosporus]|uniref:methyltransferase domain-containing protein n=1 Tax=Brevibacillus laterosporus TaxID=1465 RepID=UPI000E6B7237|nr:methyltransferase domain-containing protein [Brevibacillus laterosporus]AYB38416.1 methyltransferase domain-containing protein [Brevibacillus laterosporus]MBM7110786.1 bifunctional 3-demethylubiquinone-9 3-methyltransferase/ 2-octaprenyl-6-hydroxy phenol methylase [Brevibacillus laterosporus]
MAIIQLTSSNPDLSFILKKNPASGMQIRSMRKGISYGWYASPTTYAIYFQDADHEVSYRKAKENSYGYVNVSRYNSPVFPLNTINEYFGTVVKNRHEKDREGYQHECKVSLIHIDMAHYVSFFDQYFEGFSIEIEPLVHKSYQLTIRTSYSLHELLMFASLLFLFLSLLSDEYMDVTDSIIVKYIDYINKLDAPYFIRYLFARNVVTDRKLFQKYGKELEKSNRHQLKLQYGGTAIQRRDAIKGKLSFTRAIVDIGSGEGFYAIPFAKKIEPQFYYAIDISEHALSIIDKKAEQAELANVLTYPSLDTFLMTYEDEPVDVICTEVIEHMSKEEAEVFLKQMLTQIAFETCIITTPNADFNQFYALDKYRHDDHKWEMGTEEFQSFIEPLLGDEYIYHFFQIGDLVDGISITQGVHILRKGEEGV